MTEEIQDLLESVKEYIERTEVTLDGEWGGSRTLEELQDEGMMPRLYDKVCKVLTKGTTSDRA